MGEIIKKIALKNGFLKDKNFIRLIYIFAIIFVLCSLMKPTLFLKASNFQSMARQFPEFGIIAIGISLTMLTGGIDLSAVFMANLSAILAAKVMMGLTSDSAPLGQTIGVIILAVLVSLLTGFFCGLLNGFLVSKVGIPAILTTLGTQQLFWGLAIVITEGRSLSGMPALFSEIGNTSIGGFLPVTLLVFILCALAASVLLSKTKLGAELYLLGTNSTASVYAGLNNDRLLMSTYSISGVLAAIAGLIMMTGSNSCRADYGQSYTMQCILIAVMGGVSPNGGFGNVKGVVSAIVILQMLSSTLNMFENVSNFYRDIIWGVALIAVLIVNFTINEREMKKSLK